MANLLLFNLNEEQDRMKQKIVGRDKSVIFDGTTRLGEAMVILITGMLLMTGVWYSRCFWFVYWLRV